MPQCPLLTAALVALCGVSLVVFSNFWSPGSGGEEIGSPHEQHLREQYVNALNELRRAGVSNGVELVDFGDGLGLGVSQAVPQGAVILQVPEGLALNVDRVQSCTGDWFAEDEVHCRIERVVVDAVARKEVTRLVGLLVLLVTERRRSLGLLGGLEPTAASAVLAILPDLSWETENGIFSIDEDEFRVFSAGTSMEGWRTAAVNETTRALEFVQRALAAELGEDVGLEEMRWSFLVLHAYGQWVQRDDDDLAEDAGLDMPPEVLFLWPLLLARATPEWRHGVQLRYNKEQFVYEVVASHEMRYGEEVHFVDRRLSDASVLCFRGLQLVGRHRARLSLNVSGIARDPLAQPTLQKYGCGGQPLNLYIQVQKAVDPHFLGCMRMIVFAKNSTKLHRLERSGWLDNWPDTRMVDQRSEVGASELAISALQQVLNRLSASGADIRQRFGSDAVAARPTVRVREAETTVVVSLLKSMKELQLVSSNEYLFDALRTETERKRPGSSAAKSRGYRDKSGDRSR